MTMTTLTFETAKQIKSGKILYHCTMKNADGSPVRARVMGQVKTWKTRPNSIRIPMKHGLYDYFQIGQGETDKAIDQPLENWSLDEK